MAETILEYVPQRQILPFMAWTISASVGLPFARSRTTPDRIMPGVQ
jgi:hypothetical protein